MNFNTWPTYEEDEISAAIQCLRSGKVNYWSGEQGKLFESEFATQCESNHAVAVANGTLALELALFSLDIKPGDEVIVTPRSFVASASCIVMRGATPVFADVDPVTQNITAATIERVISNHTKAIITVHHAGWPCEMDKIMELANAHKLYVIEDCAQALGAKYNGRPVGSFGHLAAFSFCQDKIVSTGGEGGMLVTSDPELWKRAWSFKDHGKSYEKTHRPSSGHTFRWVHDSFGTNWRMTEMQAAIGRVQLKKLNSWCQARRSNAAVLNRRFSDIPALRVTMPPPEVYHAYYKYYAFLKPEKLKRGWDRNRVVENLNKKGIPCFTGTCPGIYLEKAFSGSYSKQTNLFTSEWLGETSLMFPVHPTLNNLDMEIIADGVDAVITKASVPEISSEHIPEFA